MPAAVAGVLAKGWDALGRSTPLRGPLMFSSDFIAEMKVGGWVGGGGWEGGREAWAGLRQAAGCGSLHHVVLCPALPAAPGPWARLACAALRREPCTPCPPSSPHPCTWLPTPLAPRCRATM